jgi:hypothetical protein
MNYDTEIKRLEQQQQELAQKMEALNKEKELQAEREAKLENLYNESGYPTPRAFVDALIAKYDLRLGGSSNSSTSGGKGSRRKRTTMTAELRDQIKQQVQGGQSKNKVAKEREISYAVVTKVINGEYDNL